MKAEMFALLNNQGTAMAETALCWRHTSASYRRAMHEITQSEPDYVPGSYFVDCSENDALACNVCGAKTGE